MAAGPRASSRYNYDSNGDYVSVCVCSSSSFGNDTRWHVTLAGTGASEFHPRAITKNMCIRASRCFLSGLYAGNKLMQKIVPPIPFRYRHGRLPGDARGLRVSASGDHARRPTTPRFFRRDRVAQGRRTRSKRASLWYAGRRGEWPTPEASTHPHPYRRPRGIRGA
jgi:hypothetical protein